MNCSALQLEETSIIERIVHHSISGLLFGGLAPFIMFIHDSEPTFKGMYLKLPISVFSMGSELKLKVFYVQYICAVW